MSSGLCTRLLRAFSRESPRAEQTLFAACTPYISATPTANPTVSPTAAAGADEGKDGTGIGGDTIPTLSSSSSLSLNTGVVAALAIVSILGLLLCSLCLYLAVFCCNRQRKAAAVVETVAVVVLEPNDQKKKNEDSEGGGDTINKTKEQQQGKGKSKY